MANIYKIYVTSQLNHVCIIQGNSCKFKYVTFYDKNGLNYYERWLVNDYHHVSNGMWNLIDNARGPDYPTLPTFYYNDRPYYFGKWINLIKDKIYSNVLEYLQERYV